jgi:hypothetical protein
MRPLFISATVFENTVQDLLERDGFASKVVNGWKLREAISLAPWLQPGDPWTALSK